MIGMLIFGLLRAPRPADAPAEPPLTATADAVQPVAADGWAATAAPAIDGGGDGRPPDDPIRHVPD